MASKFKLISDLINQTVTGALNRKPIAINRNKPLVTFSFDDFPASAYENAVAVLDKYGIKATYFVAMSLKDGVMYNEPLFSERMVRALHASGHEIASHTFGHLRCRETGVDDLRKDLEKNSRALFDITGEEVSSFSYPYGDLSVSSKKLAGEMFAASRGIQPGINSGTIDLNLLKANKIYSHLPISQPQKLINENKAKNGWLIFYTHDVRTNPSDYGCTPAYFEEVVRGAVESGAEIVTVKKATELINNK